MSFTPANFSFSTDALGQFDHRCGAAQLRKPSGHLGVAPLRVRRITSYNVCYTKLLRLYYFGLNQPGLAAICDLDSGKDTVYGNDLEIDDIIWMGEHPSMKDLAALCAADGARPMADLTLELKKAIAAGRKVQILPTYRGDTVLWLAELCGLPTAEIKNLVSEA